MRHVEFLVADPAEAAAWHDASERGLLWRVERLIADTITVSTVADTTNALARKCLLFRRVERFVADVAGVTKCLLFWSVEIFIADVAAEAAGSMIVGSKGLLRRCGVECLVAQSCEGNV